MNTEQARALVNETFPQAFDKGRFLNFAINLLNHFDESKAQRGTASTSKTPSRTTSRSFERLGTYTSPDKEKLDVLIVHLTTESETRTRPHRHPQFRRRPSQDAATDKDAALVAFVSPTERQWRFSYVKMEYAAVENRRPARSASKTRLTPARRFSYIVGEGESCHTAQSRFLDLLQDTENNPTLAQIEDAFSVEAVTKEFFKQYAELFGEIQDGTGQARRQRQDHRRRVHRQRTSAPWTSPRSSWARSSSSTSCKRKAGWASPKDRTGALARTISSGGWPTATYGSVRQLLQRHSRTALLRHAGHRPRPRSLVQPLQLPHPVPQRRPVRAARRLRLAQDRHHPAQQALHQHRAHRGRRHRHGRPRRVRPLQLHRQRSRAAGKGSRH